MKRISITVWVIVLAGCEQSGSVDPYRLAEQFVPAEETPADFTATLGKIIDGDTIDVLNDANETIRIRLNGIDCPERGQPFGDTATEFVRDTIGQASVRIVPKELDRYGRTVADVYFTGGALGMNGSDRAPPDLWLNQELVQAGLAWHYKRYSDDTRLAESELIARERVGGLWSISHGAIAPWEWRGMSVDERDEYR